jgi:hypothetical protein
LPLARKPAAFFLLCHRFGWLGRFNGGSQEVANGIGGNDRTSADFGRLNAAVSDLPVEGSPSNAHQTGGGIDAVAEFFELIV